MSSFTKTSSAIIGVRQWPAPTSPPDAAGRRSAGGQEPLAHQGVGKQRYWRIAGALDVVRGLHHAWQRAHFDRHTLLGYFRALEAAYPKARRMFIALDNWPVHSHADVLAGLQDSRVRLLPVPTYAPWTNPEEKVWRKLYAEVLHRHDFAERWPDLRPVVQQWLDTADTSPTDLLRYVGLLCPN